jgi:PKD repeat protein
MMSAASVYAQISINKNHMPGSGDDIEYSTASPIGISVSKTGADVSWDYTKLTNIGDGVEEYLTSLRTPYIFSFGFTTFGKKLQDTIGFSSFQFKNIYTFYRNTNSSFTDVGIGFQFAALPLPQTGKHTDPDEIYVFPLEYGDKDSTTFDVEVPISAGIKIGSFFRSGNRVTTVDGWGTISTPYAKNVSCIRVKSIITELDSIEVPTASLSFGQTITRIEYKWLSTTEKIPLLTITGNEVLGNFVPSIVQYRNEWSKVTPIVVEFESDHVSPKQGIVVSLTNKSVGEGLSYKWSVSPDAGFIYVNGTSETEENPKIVFQDTGWYSVTLTATDKNGSKDLTKENYIHVRDKNSSLEQMNNEAFNIYPNPTSAQVFINPVDQNENYSVKIFSLDGKIVLQQNGTGETEINLPTESGMYVLKITSKNVSHTLRVLKL